MHTVHSMIHVKFPGASFAYIFIIFTLSFILILASCSNGYLRGRATPSEDGKTYLNIEDDNGGQCVPISVDGKIWNYRINEKGPISPGIHKIKCGGEIEFEIPEGFIFHFDYWGP